ncbi:unnamed protein product [Vitrella brassicaformis CCMP3155]|uniref:PLD phosphodiesterase domain-containing protein n=2 Tax=Vitrella brassicaformis TaxID=1169539 RepID=A0A0G4H5X4_VITBC|nr:unnamed protein product [Vitrella brassicaformis CCMP3155]|eukprot:CEM38982.1 unnamed protein product [Vitrella brassicaformis CCMP3155]
MLHTDSLSSLQRTALWLLKHVLGSESEEEGACVEEESYDSVVQRRTPTDQRRISAEIDLTRDDAHDGTAENPQDLTQDDDAPAKRAEPARKKGRASETAWLWRCQPFYLNAIVNYGGDGEGNEGCLSIRDVIDGPAEEMLICCMRFDLPWLVSECPVMQTMRHITILTGDTHNMPRRILRLESLRRSADDMLASSGATVAVEAVPLPKGTHSTFHPKLILLAYADRIRVCITSANFLYDEWWKKNQTVYVQDFPRKQEDGAELRSSLGEDMEDQLSAFIGATTKADDWCDKIKAFDYSTAIGQIVASVPSVEGNHVCSNKTVVGPSVNRWGHMRLRHLLRHQADPQNMADFSVVCQVSSIGSLDADWIEEFLSSLCSSGSHPQIKADIPWQLVLPTEHEVRTSLEGWPGGSSIKVARESLQIADKADKSERDLPRGALHRWGTHDVDGRQVCEEAAIPYPPGRSSSCPHLKTFLKYGYRSTGSARRPEVAWVYVGSHNLSKAAWGELKGGKDEMDKDNGLYVKSYELGILISPHTLRGLTPPPPRATPHTQPAGSSSSTGSSSGAPRPMRSFMWRKSEPLQTGSHPVPRLYAATARCPTAPHARVPLVRVPLPYPLPPLPYSPRDKVWMTNSRHTGRDSRGKTCADYKWKVVTRTGFSRAEF